MLNLNALEMQSRLPYDRLIEALREGLKSAISTPPRAHHAVSDQGDLLMLMPSWRSGKLIGVKLTSVFPTNAARSEPMIHAIYALFDGANGKPVATLNGTELTKRRTAAIAALGTDLLAGRREHLLVMGTGALALEMVASHHSLGAWKTTTVWGRSPEKGEALVEALSKTGVAARFEADAAKAVGAADVICCVTGTRSPIIKGEWVREGTHVNLIGAYMPEMREADTDLMQRALIYGDRREAVLTEGGDLLIPIGEGKLTEAALIADLSELVQGAPPQRAERAVTVFKSVGFGAFDLIAAECALQA
jgi:ornithine cyclodeaminase/alanine dehydrogenase-like protein (mu-crystallin family)